MDQDDSSRPAMVGRAVMLLYSSLGIGVLRIIMEYQRLAQKTSIGFVLFGGFRGGRSHVLLYLQDFNGKELGSCYFHRFVYSWRSILGRAVDGFLSG